MIGNSHLLKGHLFCVFKKWIWSPHVIKPREGKKPEKIKGQDKRLDEQNAQKKGVENEFLYKKKTLKLSDKRQK